MAPEEKKEDREKHEISLEDIPELKKSSVEIAVDKKERSVWSS